MRGETRKQRQSEYLQAYVERAQIGLDLKGWLFRTAVGRTGQLSERPMTQADVDAPERLSRGASAADLIRKADSVRHRTEKPGLRAHWTRPTEGSRNVK